MKYIHGIYIIHTKYIPGILPISSPGRTVGWLWNLRSEWTTWRSPYPAVPGVSPAHRLSAQTGPCPTCSQNARLGTGPRARKAGYQPAVGAPATGPPGEDGTPLGAYESTQGTLQPFRLGPATSRTTWLPV
jgi:hypothetical protein